MTLLLAGTTDGLYVMESDESRRDWKRRGPYLIGQDISAVAIDARDGVTLFAGSEHGIFRSDDRGEMWRPSGDGLNADRVWTLVAAPAHSPGVLFAGCEPASLFRSPDGGKTWHEYEAITARREKEKWQPGFGGLCLNSIVCDPENAKRMWVGVSVAGVLCTEDGGATWEQRMAGITDACPEADSDEHTNFGHWCIHKLSAPLNGAPRLYQKNHCGIYRTDDGGRQWTDISAGLPWRGGFPLVAHPHDPEMVYVIPAEHTESPTPHVPGALRVFRSPDTGRTWEALANGLPTEGDHRIYREAMTVDSLHPCGVYFGTKQGEVFASGDEGDSWRAIATGLPAIRAVRCAALG